MKKKLKPSVFEGWMNGEERRDARVWTANGIHSGCAYREDDSVKHRTVKVWNQEDPYDEFMHDDRRVRVTVEFLNDYQSDSN